jgi:hypothetical protein
MENTEIRVEVYGLGTLCVGYNLPFDLSRIAIRYICGTGKNSRRFSFELSRDVKWPRLRIEQISTRGAFIAFAPRTKLNEREKPFFAGWSLQRESFARLWAFPPAKVETAHFDNGSSR